jgi:hypothetical protein
MASHDAHASRSEAPDGFVNALMIQNVLVEPEWASVLGEADQRGITPLCTRT